MYGTSTSASATHLVALSAPVHNREDQERSEKNNALFSSFDEHQLPSTDSRCSRLSAVAALRKLHACDVSLHAMHRLAGGRGFEYAQPARLPSGELYIHCEITAAATRDGGRERKEKRQGRKNFAGLTACDNLG